MEARFAADAMLGSLARWLRLLGYDTLYFRDGEDSDLADRARRGRRVLLTRDRQLARRRSAGRVVLLRSQRLRGQWLELVRACALRPRRGTLLTRCGDCNTRLRPLSRRAARGRVPAYVHATRRRFRRCPTCGRVFWRATHAAGIASRLDELLETARRMNRSGSAPLRGGRAAPGRRARRSP